MKFGNKALLFGGVMMIFIQTFAMRPTVDPKRNIQLVYGSAKDNRSPQTKEYVEALLFEGQMGRYRIVRMEETESDSSTFTASVDLSEWADLDEVYPEIYFGSSHQFAAGQVADFVKQVEAGKVPRSPIVLKKHASGLQIIDVFKTRTDFQAAIENYKTNMNLLKTNETLENKINVKLPDQALIDRATKISKVVHLATLERKESEQQIRRERQQYELDKKLSEMAQKKGQNQKESEKFLHKGLKFYQDKNYLKAEEFFKKSLELSPRLQEALYYYGVTLYRLEKFEQALIHLNLVKAQGVRLIETKYFIALTHYNLKELNRAIILFRAVKASKNKDFSAPASFYEGLILYSQEKFVEAKEPFEYVLDNSKNPQLDAKAESYLEDIAWKIYYKKNKLKEWAIYLELQGIYDSNILFATEDEQEQGQAGLSNKKSGGRTQAVVDAEYKFLYDEQNELSAHFNSSYYYSFDSEFKRADPWLMDLEVPYVRKTKLWNKAAQWRVIPGYEVLYMDALDEGERKNIQSEGGVAADLTLVNDAAWISTYSLEISATNSHLEDLADGKDNADALTYELRVDNSFYVAKSKKAAWIPSLVYKTNSAEGINKTYRRLDLGITYMDQRFWNATLFANMNMYQLEFPDHDNLRTDTNTSLSLGFNKSLGSHLGLGFVATQAVNNSNLAANEYKKTTVITQVNYTF